MVCYSFAVRLLHSLPFSSFDWCTIGPETSREDEIAQSVAAVGWMVCRDITLKEMFKTERAHATRGTIGGDNCGINIGQLILFHARNIKRTITTVTVDPQTSWVSRKNKVVQGVSIDVVPEHGKN